MLNKEERRLMETYVLPLLERVIKLSFDPEKEHGDRLVKKDTDGSEGLWVAFSKIYQDVDEARKILENILKDKHVNKLTWDQKDAKAMKKLQQKFDEHDQKQEEMETILKNHEKQVIANFLKKQQGAFKHHIDKKEAKAFLEGARDAKMSDDAILRRAEMIKLQRELSS